MASEISAASEEFTFASRAMYGVIKELLLEYSPAAAAEFAQAESQFTIEPSASGDDMLQIIDMAHEMLIPKYHAADVAMMAHFAKQRTVAEAAYKDEWAKAHEPHEEYEPYLHGLAFRLHEASDDDMTSTEMDRQQRFYTARRNFYRGAGGLIRELLAQGLVQSSGSQ